MAKVTKFYDRWGTLNAQEEEFCRSAIRLPRLEYDTLSNNEIKAPADKDNSNLGKNLWNIIFAHRNIFLILQILKKGIKIILSMHANKHMFLAVCRIFQLIFHT